MDLASIRVKLEAAIDALETAKETEVIECAQAMAALAQKWLVRVQDELEAGADVG